MTIKAGSSFIPDVKQLTDESPISQSVMHWQDGLLNDEHAADRVAVQVLLSYPARLLQQLWQQTRESCVSFDICL